MSDESTSELSRPVKLVHLAAGQREERPDEVAHEEPLELQLDGTPFAVVMRTPGHDEDLGTGFLFTEGIIGALSDLESMQHCTVVPTPRPRTTCSRCDCAPPSTCRVSAATCSPARGAGGERPAHRRHGHRGWYRLSIDAGTLAGSWAR